LQLPGAGGAHKLDQTGSHPHHVVHDPAQRFLVVLDRAPIKFLRSTLTLRPRPPRIRRIRRPLHGRLSEGRDRILRSFDAGMIGMAVILIIATAIAGALKLVTQKI
jgi:hypothetical protein